MSWFRSRADTPPRPPSATIAAPSPDPKFCERDAGQPQPQQATREELIWICTVQSMRW
jgi:hypothetical protein